MKFFMLFLSTFSILILISQPLEAQSYDIQNVNFSSRGTNITGILFVPSNTNGSKLPALTTLGPFCFVKEQAPVQYATRMAKRGYITLIFDPRNHGESGTATKRRHESPSLKIEDIIASVEYLSSLDIVDSDKIGGIGICQGAVEMMAASAGTKKLKAIGLVTGNYIDPENSKKFFGSEEGFKKRLARGDEALKKFNAEGIVQYDPIVDPTCKTAGLPQEKIWEWYHGWVPKSRWENRYTTMSAAEVWRFDTVGTASKVQAPTLFVHGTYSDGGKTFVSKMLDAVPVSDKKLAWFENVVHTEFYDDPVTIDRAVVELDAWFDKYLNNGGKGGVAEAKKPTKVELQKQRSSRETGGNGSVNILSSGMTMMLILMIAFFIG